MVTSYSLFGHQENIHATMSLTVNIKRWHGVAKWSWDVKDENCGICSMPFDSFCLDCKVPGDDCPPVWGKCKHAFHMHCIIRWLQTNRTNTCCMCRRPWEFAEGPAGGQEE